MLYTYYIYINDKDEKMSINKRIFLNLLIIFEKSELINIESSDKVGIEQKKRIQL